MSEDANQPAPRTWWFWLLPPLLCAGALLVHFLFHVPTGPYEGREPPATTK